MDVLFANGVIKVVENQLFDKSHYAKLAKTVREEFVPALVSLGYGKNFAGGDLDSLIQTELVEAKRLLDEISPNRKLTDLFYLSFDAMNLKVLYKEQNYHVATPDILVGTGAIETPVLTEAIRTGNLASVPPQFVPLLENVRLAAEKASSPRNLSARIDAEIFGFAFKTLKRTPEKALQAYFEALADFTNVLTFMRSRALRWEVQNFLEMFLPGGTLPPTVFQDAYSLEGENLIRAFRDPYSEKIARILKTHQENSDLDRLERSFDQLLLEVVKEFRHDAFGIGPIICFFLKKNAEAKNIRRIYGEESVDLTDLLD